MLDLPATRYWGVTIIRMGYVGVAVDYLGA
jgi:hypothetical protein